MDLCGHSSLYMTIETYFSFILKDSNYRYFLFQQIVCVINTESISPLPTTSKLSTFQVTILLPLPSHEIAFLAPGFPYLSLFSPFLTHPYQSLVFLYHSSTSQSFHQIFTLPFP